jgi:hypothetical protein
MRVSSDPKVLKVPLAPRVTMVLLAPLDLPVLRETPVLVSTFRVLLPRQMTFPSPRRRVTPTTSKMRRSSTSTAPTVSGRISAPSRVPREFRVQRVSQVLRVALDLPVLKVPKVPKAFRA